MTVKSLIQILAAFLVTGILAFGLEIFYFNRLASGESSEPVHFTPAELVSAAEIDGFELRDDALVAVGDQATLTLNQLDLPVHQVILTYEAIQTAEYYMTATAPNQIEPEADESSLTAPEATDPETTAPEATDPETIAPDAITRETSDPVTYQITDAYSTDLSASATVLDRRIGSLIVKVPDAGLRITGLTLDTHFPLNGLRIVLIWLACLLVLLVWILSPLVGARVEWIFLIVGLGLGVIMILLAPVRPDGWDEQIHFSQVSRHAFQPLVEYTPAAVRYTDLSIPVTNSQYDQMQTRSWLNELDHADPVIPVAANPPLRISQLAYAPYTLMLKLAQILGLSFTNGILAARLAGLITYLLITALAIRRLPFGKHLLAVYALLPTLLFQATRLSYDTVTIATSFLFFAILVCELASPEQLLSRCRIALLIGSAVLMTSAKAIYVPIVALGLLMPSGKFLSERKRLLFDLTLILLILWTASSFVWPTVFEPSVTGDPRVAGASIAGQLAYIRTQPLQSLALILTSAIGTAGHYFLGSAAILSYAYSGTLEQPNWGLLTTLLLLFLALTDTKDSGVNRPVRPKDKYSETLQGTDRIWIALMVFSTMLLIWLALYLSFTPVGQSRIDGVQPRYYFPLAIPMLMLFNSDRIRHQFDPSTYLRLAILPIILLNGFGLYTRFLVPFNL